MAHEENAHAAPHQVTVGKYMIGFVLAIVLTIASFAVLVAGVQPKGLAVAFLSVAAVAQILVHLHYFLHLDLSKENRWNFITIAFTALILLIFIAGTVWVIYTLNLRMM